MRSREPRALLAAALVLGAPLAAASLAPVEGQTGGIASTVRGRVLDHETGAPLADATVSLTTRSQGAEAFGIRMSDAEGLFVFEDLSPGTYVLTVARMGFRTYQDSLVVASDAEVRIVVELSVSPIELNAVVVMVSRSPLMAGFEARRRQGMGTFITRDQIEAANPIFVSDLFRVVPGVTFARRRTGNLEIRFRGSAREGRCRPTFWVNGARAIDRSVGEIGIDQILSPFEVEAVEVYRGAGAVPAQFGPEPCGAVVIWTRRPGPEADQRSLWKRLLVVAGIAGTILMLR